MIGAASNPIAAFAQPPLRGRIGSPMDGAAFSMTLEGVSRNQTPEESARQSAEELVAISLVQPALASLRENSQAAEPFAPTSAEKQFGSILDARRAQEIVRAKGFPLVDAIASRMLGQAGRLTGGAVDTHG